LKSYKIEGMQTDTKRKEREKKEKRKEREKKEKRKSEENVKYE
jgi:hypothetical protein